jgi:hypothetical protein
MCSRDRSRQQSNRRNGRVGRWLDYLLSAIGSGRSPNLHFEMGCPMLRILGSNRRACDALSRRDMIQAGGASVLGLGLADLLRAAENPGQTHLLPGFGQAKNVILLFLYGGVSQLDTLDPKPGAPEDIRGPFSPIATSLGGVQISENLPRLAKMMDRVSLVRSMSHPYPIHGVAFAATGVKHVDIPMELNRDDTRHWPYFGSVLDYLHEVDHPTAPQPAIPTTMHLPWVQSSRSRPHKRAGLFGGFLGPRYNPVVAEFVGEATNPKTYRANDPYGGIKPDCRFEVQGTGLPNGLTIDRVSVRDSLLDQFDVRRRDLDDSQIGSSLDRFRQLAMSVIASPRLRETLDLSKEPATLRERYGHHLFGQSALLARRLVESGTRLVSVFWDEFAQSCGTWDTHEKQTPRLRDELCPGFDQAFTALFDDLDDRGMLDETLVLCLTEHGRTPKAERRGNSLDGRGHWSQAYSCLFAGAGIRQGNLIGKTDRDAAYVVDDPVSPNDVLHTIYHLLGVNSHRLIPDRLGRPFPLVADGEIVRELLG